MVTNVSRNNLANTFSYYKFRANCFQYRFIPIYKYSIQSKVVKLLKQMLLISQDPTALYTQLFLNIDIYYLEKQSATVHDIIQFKYRLTCSCWSFVVCVQRTPCSFSLWHLETEETTNISLHCIISIGIKNRKLSTETYNKQEDIYTIKPLK